MYWCSIEEPLRHTTYLEELLFGYVNVLAKEDPRAQSVAVNGISDRMYEIADWLCIPAHILLHLCKMTIEQKHPDGSPASLKDLSGSELSTVCTVAGKIFEDDVKVFGQILIDLSQLKAIDALPRAMDAWTGGVCDILDLDSKPTKRPRRKKPASRANLPVWLVWASTMFLDIQHLLGQSDCRCFQELRETEASTKRTLDKHFEWAEDWSDIAWTDQENDVLQILVTWVETYVERDFVAKAVRMAGSDAVNAPHYLMKRHPL